MGASFFKLTRNLHHVILVHTESQIILHLCSSTTTLCRQPLRKFSEENFLHFSPYIASSLAHQVFSCRQFQQNKKRKSGADTRDEIEQKKIVRKQGLKAPHSCTSNSQKLPQLKKGGNCSTLVWKFQKQGC